MNEDAVGHIADEDPKALAQMGVDEPGNPRAGEVYRHYKGGIYSIVAVSVNESTLEIMVTYHSNLRGTNWTRTLRNFAEHVDMGNGAYMKRFARLNQ